MSERPAAQTPPQWETTANPGLWHTSPAQRRTLLSLTAGGIGVLLLATAAYLWTERSRLIEEAGERGAQRTQRLAQDLEQSLNVARTVIAQFDEQIQRSSTTPFSIPATSDSANMTEVLASLPLPFELHALGAGDQSVKLVGVATEKGRSQEVHHNGVEMLAADQWNLGAAGVPGQDLIPLSWRATPNMQGIRAYGVDLSFAAVQAWLERDRHHQDDRVSLFWLNGHSRATLLASSPTEPSEIGVGIQHDWVPFAEQTPHGSMDLVSPLDGKPRRVAFQRLSGAAGSMVIVHGTDIQTVLDDWTTKLPFFIGMALFLAAALAYSTRRLDRSLRALTKSEQQFELLLSSGQVWDWNVKERTMRYSRSMMRNLGFDNVPHRSTIETLFAHMVPEDAQRMKAAIKSHLASQTPYTDTFRTIAADGRIHWFETQGQAHWDERGVPQYMAGTIFEVTERRALEESQRQTLQHLDTVANASPILFWTADCDGKLDWVNQRWLDFTGHTLEQEIGQGWTQGIHPEDLSKRSKAIEMAQHNGRPFAIEYRLLHADGAYRWLMEQCTLRLNADGEPVGFIGSCIDRSELKQAESAAKNRGAMLEGMFNVMQDLLFVLDRQGRFKHFQGASDDNLYVAPEIFLGKTIREVMPAKIADRLHSYLQLAENGRLQEFDYLLQLPDGEHHFDARMAKLPGDSGEFMVVARDTTEREQLRRQSERLQQFMSIQARLATNFINLPVSELDTSIDQALKEVGTFANADRAYIFHYDFDHHLASNSHEWCGPGIEPAKEDLQNLNLDFFQEWVSTHVAGTTVDLPDVQTLPHSAMREILISQGIQSLIALPMSTGEGCMGFVGFDAVHTAHTYDEAEKSLLQLFAQMLVNVYERRRAEAELLRFADELEQRVDERTAQLDVSVRRLKQANLELESFAYSVSHDLKSPVRSVEGFAALLLEENAPGLDDTGRDYLIRIQRATHHMTRLINDLLAYCRMENLDKMIEPVSLATVVNQVLESMRNEIDAVGAQIVVDIPPGTTALAHPQGLSMVLRNLIDNAFKFAQPGIKPKIELTAVVTGEVTRLCLRDEGQGFDMKYHDRIFAIFQRLHRSDQIAGTGIGLAMVHKAVQRMNGRIWAESSPGQGAKFHIELPRA